MNKMQRILGAEFLGTFLLASAVFAGINPFFALAVLVLVIGGVSGAHVNPAVTLGLTSVGKHKTADVLPYWIAQVMGGLVAIVLASYLRDVSVEFNFVDFDMRVLVAEFVGAAIFLIGITMAVQQKLEGIQLAAAVGGALFLGAALGGGLNPAIAIAGGAINVIGILGALAGAVVGANIGMELSAKSKK